MKKIMAIAVLGMASLLTGCGDDGIYGNYTNKAYGLNLKLKKDSISFKGKTYEVKTWDESNKPLYIAHTKINNSLNWDFKIKKVKGGVEYLNAKFEKE